MALLTTNSTHALGLTPMPVAQGPEIVCVRMVHSLTANPTANDVAWIGDLPQDHVPVDFVLDAGDLDTNGTPTMTVSVGVLNAGKTDLDATWLAASTAAQTGVLARPTATTAVRTTPSATAKQSIGLKFPAVAATFAAGSIGVTLFYRAAYNGA